MNRLNHFSRPLLLLFWLSSSLQLWAHDPGLSTATIKLETNRLEASVVFAGLVAGEIVPLDKDGNGQISKEELAAAAAELQQFTPQVLQVKLNGQELTASAVRCYFDKYEDACLDLTFPCGSYTNLVIRSMWLPMLPPGHRQLITIQNPKREVLAERLLSANADTITIELDAKEGKTPEPTVRATSFADFFVMGVQHIWTGYDHLLFLFGLLIVTRNFAASVKIITCFTIAHSITLAVATLSLVQISSRIVEPLIAASIVYVGIENLFRGDDPKGRWLLTFGFGLIHGFGFASVLRERGVGANGSGIAVPLVSFNLGVEVGQIAIAALVLPVIWKLRAKQIFVTRWVPACSILVALLGGYWFVQRVWFTS
jgi:hydrogenase/urease accessory protein HupE